MVGVIFLLNLEYAPFIKKYTKELESVGEDFEVIYWERLETDFANEWSTVVYKERGQLGDSKLKKMISFWKYRKFLIETLKKKKYDKLIILTTLTGITIFDFLIKNYKNKFIFDIRDYTFEKNPIFSYVESLVINSSYFTAISSDGFKEFLPKSDKYVLSHNIITSEVEEAKHFVPNRSNDGIKLTFIGAVRHFDIDKKIVEIFGNKEGFNVTFHGYGVSYSSLKDICSNKYSNVELTGKYDRKNKMNLLIDSSILISYYSEDNYANQYALPNKYYDALIYKIPLWANPDVYVGKRAIENGIGLKCILGEEAPNKAREYLKSIDWNRFDLSCKNELSKILDEDKSFRNKLLRFIQIEEAQL